MAKRILVLATSFLDTLITHPPEEGKAKQMLERLVKESGGEVKLHPHLSPFSHPPDGSPSSRGRNEERGKGNSCAIEVSYRCNRNPEEPLSAEEFRDVTCVIADLEKYSRDFLSRVGIKKGGSLELIARYGIGYSSVDIKAATDFGVMVTNCPGCNALPTAEWAHSTILDIAGRRILHYQQASRGKGKEGPSRLDLSGKSLGVIGTGTIGRLVVKLMKGYEMRVIAYDPYPDEKWARENEVEYLPLKKLCQTADIITLHAACSKTIIGEEEIKLMHPTTVLVNCARGILVDYKAAFYAVKEGGIWGYGVDEIWPRNLSLEGLNIIASPHVGSDTDRGKLGMQLMSTQAVVDLMQGKVPQYLVNKEVLEK